MHNLKSCFIKTCHDPYRYEQCTENFRLEFQHMRSLHQMMAEEGCGQLYSQLFPYYDSFTTRSDGRPLLCMEYLSGRTLEHYLCSKLPQRGPSVLFSSSQILHIFRQLHDAIYWLHRGGMLQLDLSPQNILVINTDFDIRFVDFTGCYYTELSFSENASRGYKIIDLWINTGSMLSCQLRDACALLFTRLFFCGKDDYQAAFSADRQSRKGTKNYRFFDSKYPHLLDCLFSPVYTAQTTEKDLLTDWEDWYRLFQKLLRSSLS